MTALRLTCLCLAATATSAAIAAVRLGLWQSGTPGSGMFPFLAALLLLASSGGILLQEVESKTDAAPAEPRRLLLHLLALSMFAVAFTLLGTALAIFSFIIIVLRGIEHLNWLHAMAVAGILTAFCWLIFSKLLGVPLPAGLLGMI